MNWTYTDDPKNVPLDALRISIGDAQSNRPLLGDGALEYALDRASDDVPAASLICIDMIIAKFANMGKFVIGSFEVDSTLIIKEMEKIRNRMATTQGAGSGSIYAGGISVSDKTLDPADTDVVQHPFQVDMHKNVQV